MVLKQVEDEYLIQLEGVADREAAVKFRDFQLFVKQEERPELEEEEFLISELVGCTALYSEVRIVQISWMSRTGNYETIEILSEY